MAKLFLSTLFAQSHGIFVYVIVLHAVQFLSNRMQVESYFAVRGIFHPIIYNLDKHVVLSLINYTVQISLQIFLLRSAAITTR